MMVPNVIDMTGPISGETSIAATMLDAGIAIKILCLERLMWISSNIESFLSLPFSEYLGKSFRPHEREKGNFILDYILQNFYLLTVILHQTQSCQWAWRETERI